MEQDRNSKIAKNTLALYIRTAITMVVSFVSVRITLQILGSEDYGLNNLVGSIVSMLSFINGSMGTAVQRFYSYEIGKGDEGRVAKVFGVGMYLHLLVAVLSVIIGEVFAIFFLHTLNIPDNRIFAAHVVFQISLLSLFLSVIMVPYTSLLRAKEDFSKMANYDIIQAVFRLIVLYLLYAINYDKLITFSLLNLSITIFYSLGILRLARRYKETTFHIDRDRIMIKEMLSFISFLLVSVLLWLVRDKGVVILINFFFGLTTNAAYAIANQIMGFMNTFVANFKVAIVPQIMSSYSSKDYERMHKLIMKGTKITFILMLAITFPVIFETHFILSLWLNDVPQQTEVFTKLVLVNINISSFTYFLYQAVHGTGEIKEQQICMSSLYVLNIILVYIVYKLGLEAWSGIVMIIFTSILQAISNVYFAYKKVHFSLLLFVKEIVSKGAVLVLFLLIVSIGIKCMLPEGIMRITIYLVSFSLSLILMSWSYYLTSEERILCKTYFVRIKERFAKKGNNDIGFISSK